MTRFIRPVSDEERDRMKDVMHDNISDKVDTICGHIRVIYNLAKKVQQADLQYGILTECLVVMAYAKRMDNKLMEYQQVGDVKL